MQVYFSWNVHGSDGGIRIRMSNASLKEQYRLNYRWTPLKKLGSFV